MNIYISIGAQCTTATLFDRLQVKNKSLPFDWMFSTPQFVYTILKLLIEQKQIEDIIDNHFFVCDKRAVLKEVEHHILTENGPVLVNSKYNVCFPHDTMESRDKYIRRLERLKQLIFNKDIFLYFIYISVSSPNSGNYTLDGLEPIQEVYEYIEKINSILKDIRSNYKILIFHTNKPPEVIPLDMVHIRHYDIKQKNSSRELLPELVDKCKKLIESRVIRK